MIPNTVDHNGMLHRIVNSVGHKGKNWYRYKIDFDGKVAYVDGKVIAFEKFRNVWVTHFPDSGALSTIDLVFDDCNLCECFSGSKDEISSMAQEIQRRFGGQILNDC